jgi:protein-S-isoprenylcysteine O-methyltransferase Ste14
MGKAVPGFLGLFVALCAAVFLPARTLDWWQAWLLLAIFFGACVAITADLARRDPALLSRRLRGGPAAERRPAQKVAQAVTSLSFLALFVVSGLDHRFGWSAMPLPLSIAGDLLVALGMTGIFLVFRENSYAASTIEAFAGQKVISTGPYAIVRHPMYAAAMLLLLGIPLALGSDWALLALPPLVLALVLRILDEEKLLDAELPGYAEYRARVKYRLLPGVW